MDFAGAIKNGFRNYASAVGRASRSEFWYWMLFAFLLSAAGSIVDAALFGADSERELVGPLLSLAVLLPSVSVMIRRLHDLDRKWPWLLLWFTGIGTVVLLVWFCRQGTTGPNRFGDDPLGAEAPTGAPAIGAARARRTTGPVILAIVVCVVAGAAYVAHSAYRAIQRGIASGAFCSHCVQVNNGGPMIKGSGHPVTENRTVAPFTALRVDSAADVVIDRTGTPGLSITADDNLVSFFTSEVRDGTLYLADAPRKSFQTGDFPVFRVSVADLHAIEIHGSGEVKAQHLDGPALTITVVGSADVKLAGRSDDLTLAIKGSGDVDAGGLAAKRAKVVMSGSGDATVNASDTLDVHMSGSGDLEYLGSPKITKDVHGSGSIAHK
jgi:uncharacterized membrane protein YhaH (DUF805 family)